MKDMSINIITSDRDKARAIHSKMMSHHSINNSGTNTYYSTDIATMEYMTKVISKYEEFDDMIFLVQMTTLDDEVAGYYQFLTYNIPLNEMMGISTGELQNPMIDGIANKYPLHMFIIMYTLCLTAYNYTEEDAGIGLILSPDGVGWKMLCGDNELTKVTNTEGLVRVSSANLGNELGSVCKGHNTRSIDEYAAKIIKKSIIITMPSFMDDIDEEIYNVANNWVVVLDTLKADIELYKKFHNKGNLQKQQNELIN